jgi:hypothetical protein
MPLRQFQLQDLTPAFEWPQLKLQPRRYLFQGPQLRPVLPANGLIGTAGQNVAQAVGLARGSDNVLLLKKLRTVVQLALAIPVRQGVVQLKIKMLAITTNWPVQYSSLSMVTCLDFSMGNAQQGAFAKLWQPSPVCLTILYGFSSQTLHRRTVIQLT